MSDYQPASRWKDRFQLVLSSFLQQQGLPFSSVLSEKRIEPVFYEADASFANGEEDPVNTPAITRLAYNLIRQTMLQAALRADLSPRDVSFTHALQTVASSWQLMPVLSPAGQAAQIDAALGGLCQLLVGRRPDRIEPRAVKRRPKPHDYLTKPRAEARAELLRPKV